MNETLKQNRLLRDHGDESLGLCSRSDKNLNEPHNDVSCSFLVIVAFLVSLSGHFHLGMMCHNYLLDGDG